MYFVLLSGKCTVLKTETRKQPPLPFLSTIIARLQNYIPSCLLTFEPMNHAFLAAQWPNFTRRAGEHSNLHPSLESDTWGSILGCAKHGFGHCKAKEDIELLPLEEFSSH